MLMSLEVGGAIDPEKGSPDWKFPASVWTPDVCYTHDLLPLQPLDE